MAAVARVDGEAQGASYLADDAHLHTLVSRVASTLASTRSASTQRETAANDGAAPCHAAATRLLVALFRADRNRVASRVAKLSLTEKQACEHALRDAAPDFKGAVSSVRKEEVSKPSNIISEETERAARATLSAAVAALAREVRGGADAARGGHGEGGLRERGAVRGVGGRGGAVGGDHDACVGLESLQQSGFG